MQTWNFTLHTSAKLRGPLGIYHFAELSVCDCDAAESRSIHRTYSGRLAAIAAHMRVQCLFR
jgi:hypothetical protein